MIHTRFLCSVFGIGKTELAGLGGGALLPFKMHVSYDRIRSTDKHHLHQKQQKKNIVERSIKTKQATEKK